MISMLRHVCTNTYTHAHERIMRALHSHTNIKQRVHSDQKIIQESRELMLPSVTNVDLANK